MTEVPTYHFVSVMIDGVEADIIPVPAELLPEPSSIQLAMLVGEWGQQRADGTSPINVNRLGDDTFHFQFTTPTGTQVNGGAAYIILPLQ